jgi:GAF domain-containing protein/HAMP domain-containing protein
MDSQATLLINEARRGLWNAVEAANTKIIPYYSVEITEATDQIEQLTRQRHEAALAEVDIARQMIRNVSITWGLVLVLALLGINLVTQRSIAEPLDQLAKAASRLAAGHLEERVPVERADEFGHLATAFNQMADRLQASYAELEARVAERTRALQEANYALQRRAIQLEASAEVSRAITSIFNVDELLRKAVYLIRDRFGFYHAGVFLMDEAGEWAVLQEATGEAGEKMKIMGHRLHVGETSMVGWTALHRRPRIALDVGADAVHFANPLLPYTRSEMTLPLMVGGRLLGVLDVQSTEEAAFDEDDIRTLQSMADQLAIAIENARRISDEAMLLEATSPIFRASRLLTTAATLDEVGQAIVTTIAETGAEGCFMALFEPPGGQPEAIRFVTTWRQDGQPPIRPGTRFPITVAHMRPEAMQKLWSLSDLDQPSLLNEEEVNFFRRAGMRAVANIPLRIGEQPLGFIVAYRLSPGPFPAAALRLYEALTDMASVAVERVRLLEILQQRAQQEEALRVITDQITTTFDLQRMLQTALSQLSKALNATGGYVELGVR